MIWAAQVDNYPSLLLYTQLKLKESLPARADATGDFPHMTPSNRLRA
jgi:hypothetical protein